MYFTVRQNGMLDGIYHMVYRLSLMTGEFIKRRMAIRIRVAKLQRVVQVVFGNFVDLRDHMNSHPGVNGTHVTCLDLIILLPETLHCLKSINRCKGKNPKHEEQQKAKQI